MDGTAILEMLCIPVAVIIAAFVVMASKERKKLREEKTRAMLAPKSVIPLETSAGAGDDDTWECPECSLYHSRDALECPCGYSRSTRAASRRRTEPADRARRARREPEAEIVREKVIEREVLMVRCKYCGTIVRLDANTCPNCSAPLEPA